MTSPLYLRTLSSIPSFPCGPIPRITEGLRFGGDPCHLTHAGLRRPTHVGESVRRFPRPKLITLICHKSPVYKEEQANLSVSSCLQFKRHLEQVQGSLLERRGLR